MKINYLAISMLFCTYTINSMEPEEAPPSYTAQLQTEIPIQPWSIAINPKGTLIAIAAKSADSSYTSQDVYIFPTDPKNPVNLKIPMKNPGALKFSPDNKILWVMDSQLALLTSWDVNTGACTNTYKIDVEPAQPFIFLQNTAIFDELNWGRWFATSPGAGFILLAYASTYASKGNMITTRLSYEKLASAVYSPLVYNQDGTRIAYIGSDQHSILIKKLPSLDTVRTLQFPEGYYDNTSCSYLDWSPNNEWLAVATQSKAENGAGKVYVWRLEITRNANPTYTVDDAKGGSSGSLKFTDMGELLIIGSPNVECQTILVRSGETLPGVFENTWANCNIAANNSNNLVALGDIKTAAIYELIKKAATDEIKRSGWCTIS